MVYNSSRRAQCQLAACLPACCRCFWRGPYSRPEQAELARRPNSKMDSSMVQEVQSYLNTIFLGRHSLFWDGCSCSFHYCSSSVKSHARDARRHGWRYPATPCACTDAAATSLKGGKKIENMQLKPTNLQFGMCGLMVNTSSVLSLHAFTNNVWICWLYCKKAFVILDY